MLQNQYVFNQDSQRAVETTDTETVFETRARSSYTPGIPQVLSLDDGAQNILAFERTRPPVETELIHSFPMPTEEIVFDEPNLENIYPTTEPPPDFFSNLDLTATEFKGDNISTPLSLDADRPLFGEVSQQSIPEGGEIIKQSFITPEAGAAVAKEKKFNIWLLIIAVAVLFGVYYMNKSKL